MVRSIWVVVLLVAGVSCTHEPKRKGKKNAPASVEEPVAVPAAPEAPVAASGDCIPAQPGFAKPPFFMRDHGIIVTRVLKACTAAGGQEGYAADTAWMAMGFPCTGGGGQIEWKGYYTAPKLVSFSVSTDCPTNPTTAEEAIKVGRSMLGLNERSRLMAYTPMAVQYWEVDEYNEMNTGSSIEFRESASLSKGWENFKNNLPLRVRLYGRENVWGQGDQLYVVEADMQMAGKAMFKLTVVDAKLLTDEQTEQLKQKCAALRPRRNCREIFN